MIKLISNTTLNYNKEKISNSMGLVVHHESNWRDLKNYDRSQKLIYLLLTLSSLYKIVEEINLYICDGNFDFLYQYFTHLQIIKLDVPAVTQQNKKVFPIGKHALMKKDWDKKDLIIFTESDQILYLKDFDNLKTALNKEAFISPHRLEKKFNHASRLNRATITFNNDEYTLYNHYENELDLKDNFYHSKTFRSSYGACWIATKELLSDINFHEDSEFILESQIGRAHV